MGAKRRDAVRALFNSDRLDDGANGEPRETAGDPGVTKDPAPRQTSSAIRAMGLSLSGLTDEIDAARALKREVSQSGRIVDLDPALIDAAFVCDRLSDGDGDPAFAALVKSMRDNGQQVPVLVRSHPGHADRYQTAYGHRRIRAAASLGLPVKAIVRALTDSELVLAQGKENTERRDLSFIERALFAKALTERGFERAIVQDALSLHKSEMARLIQIADAVPAHMARAIGPAPKAGRGRWTALAELLKSEAGRAKAQDEIFSKRFRDADSDRRFRLLFDRLAKKPQPAKAADVTDREGCAVARVVRGAKPRIDFVGETGDNFAAFVAAELPELLERFRKSAAQ